jgi:hypothetical protein
MRFARSTRYLRRAPFNEQGGGRPASAASAAPGRSTRR